MDPELARLRQEADDAARQRLASRRTRATTVGAPNTRSGSGSSSSVRRQ